MNDNSTAQPDASLYQHPKPITRVADPWVLLKMARDRIAHDKALLDSEFMGSVEPDALLEAIDHALLRLNMFPTASLARLAEIER